MKTLLAAVMLFGAIAAAARGQGAAHERAVRDTIAAFYAAFNAHSFDEAAEFTTEDWNHINPSGGWTKGRDNVLQELRDVHSTFLRGVTDTVEGVTVRFASDDVAVATVSSRVGTYVTPDGKRHENERQRRTFVVVNRGGRWLVMHDQNTVIGAGVP